MEAYDLGAILVLGTHRRLNHFLTDYYAKGKFKDGVEIPETVAQSVAAYIDSFDKEDTEQNAQRFAMMKRVCGYFKDVSLLPDSFKKFEKELTDFSHCQ